METVHTALKELLVFEVLAYSTSKAVDVALKNSLYPKSLNSLRDRTRKIVDVALEALAALELLHTHVLENGTA